MKWVMQTRELEKALYRVQGIADRKSTMPILSHVLLAADVRGELTVSATDMDVGLVGTYEAQVQQGGKVAVQARQLYDIIKSLSEPNVTLERQDNNWIDINAGSSHFHLVGMAANEFPVLPEHEQIRKFPLPAAKLMQMVDRTLFCVSSDENRHNLSGIFCESPKAGVLRMVSTDGHRLAWAEAQFDSTLSLPKGAIVPRKGFPELKRVIGDSDAIETIHLGFNANSATLQAGSVVLSTRLIEGQFPDYTQVIPQTGNKQVKLSRLPFADALRRVSLLSQGRAHGVRFKFSEDHLELVAEDPEYGDAKESLQVDYKGTPLVVGFNARYILDVLGLITEQGVRFELADDLSPGVIKPLEDNGFLAVVMPMRL